MNSELKVIEMKPRHAHEKSHTDDLEFQARLHLLLIDISMQEQRRKEEEADNARFIFFIFFISSLCLLSKFGAYSLLGLVPFWVWFLWPREVGE